MKEAAKGNEAIQIASANGFHSVVGLLLKDKRADPSADCNQAIRMAVRYGHVESCLKTAVSIYQPRTTLPYEQLQQGIFFPNLDFLIYLDDRMDPFANSNIAVRFAAANGYVNIVDRLLDDERVDPSANGNKALINATENGYFNVVSRLLEDDRTDPAARNNEAIKFACRHNYYDIICLLMEEERVRRALNQATILNSEYQGMNVATRCFSDANLEHESTCCNEFMQNVLNHAMVQTAIQNQDLEGIHRWISTLWTRIREPNVLTDKYSIFD
jgi:hypothetical protein